MYYYLIKINKGGIKINNLIHLFFISYIIYIFIVFYSIYSFIELYFFHSLQGSKLKLKKNN